MKWQEGKRERQDAITRGKTRRIKELETKCYSNMYSKLWIPLPDQENAHETAMKKIGYERVRRDRAKCYRELFKLRFELDKERRLKEKYCKKNKQLRKSLSLHVFMICLFVLFWVLRHIDTV
jgi:hypothetical protein